MADLPLEQRILNDALNHRAELEGAIVDMKKKRDDLQVEIMAAVPPRRHRRG
jgi:hypothetical protein